jgi:cytochrome d ubiquinol oxidase subunit I
MIGFGLVGAIVSAVALVYLRGGRSLPRGRWFGPAVIAVMITPFLANATGWIFTEMGRQPWVVAPNPDGLPEVRLMTSDAISTSVGTATVATSLIAFTLVYAVLAVVEVGLLRSYVRAGPDAAITPKPSDDEADSERLTFAY